MIYGVGSRIFVPNSRRESEKISGGSNIEQEKSTIAIDYCREIIH